MLLTEINIDDLNILKRFRIERLLHFFTSSLPRCLIQIDAGDTLVVYCPHPWIVDELIDDLERKLVQSCLAYFGGEGDHAVARVRDRLVLLPRRGLAHRYLFTLVNQKKTNFLTNPDLLGVLQKL